MGSKCEGVCVAVEGGGQGIVAELQARGEAVRAAVAALMAGCWVLLAMEPQAVKPATADRLRCCGNTVQALSAEGKD